MRLTLVTLLAALAVLVWAFAFAATTAHAATAVDGRCGMHIGTLVRRESTGSQYRYRTGPKTAGGASTCRGSVRVKLSGAAGQAALAWQTYNLGAWNEHNVILIAAATSTVFGCNAVASGIVTALEAATAAGSDGLAYPGAAAVAGAVGCGPRARAVQPAPKRAEDDRQGTGGEVMHPKYGRIGGTVMLVCCVFLLIAGPLVWKIVAGLFLIGLAGAAYRWWAGPRKG